MVFSLVHIVYEYFGDRDSERLQSAMQDVIALNGRNGRTGLILQSTDAPD